MLQKKNHQSKLSLVPNLNEFTRIHFASFKMTYVMSRLIFFRRIVSLATVITFLTYSKAFETHAAIPCEGSPEYYDCESEY